MSSESLQILVVWERLLCKLYVKVGKFPRDLRPSLGNTIANLGALVMEHLVQARFSREKLYSLNRASIELEKLRVFVRIGAELRVLSIGELESMSLELEEAGRLLGGWIKQQQERK